MSTIPEPRPFDHDELIFKKRALRDAILCMGWLKLASVTCYVILYFLVRGNSKDETSMVIQIMLLVSIPALIVHGVLLFFGALEEKLLALEVALWLCLILASYNTVLGVMGGIYYVRTGHLTVHFFLAITFAMLTLSLFTVLCHDVLIVYAFKQLLLGRSPTEDNTTRPTTWNVI